jgi:hypothetical protein
VTNRFYTPDKTKWTGRTHIGPGPGDNRGKRISLFIFDGPQDSLVARLRSAHSLGLEAVDRLRERRAALAAGGRHTELGMKQEVADDAMKDAIPKMRRARAMVEKVEAEITERAAKLTLAKPDAEQRKDHEEIRTAMRGMTPDQRNQFLSQNRHDPVVAAAIVNGIPALSGVDQLTHSNIRAEQIQLQHGEALGEVADLKEVLSVVDKVVTLGRDELREIVGVDKKIFEEIASVAERNGGRLPFKVDSEVGQDGKPVEIARVLDLETKTWRRATSEEIMSSRSDAAAA